MSIDCIGYNARLPSKLDGGSVIGAEEDVNSFDVIVLFEAFVETIFCDKCRITKPRASIASAICDGDG